MQTLDLLIGTLGVLAAIAAGGLWLYASLITVPDNIDTIVGEMQRIGRWNAYGAWAAVVGALCAAYVFGRNL